MVCRLAKTHVYTPPRFRPYSEGAVHRKRGFVACARVIGGVRMPGGGAVRVAVVTRPWMRSIRPRTPWDGRVSTDVGPRDASGASGRRGSFSSAYGEFPWGI